MTATAAKLLANWRGAYDRVQRSSTPANIAAEQAAHDELVDYIEANDLNGSMYDPRGMA